MVNTKKDNIVIRIKDDAKQADVLEELKKRMVGLKKLYKDEKLPIYISGKVLRNKEIDEIQAMINKYLDVKVEFESPRTLGLHGITKTYNKNVATSETKYHRGSLRSGQKIEFEGSLVILGDVNDGAEVIAGENIVVLGALRGLAHAGAKGNKDAIIASSSIEAMQLRIANVVNEREKEEVYSNDRRMYAYLDEEGKMIIE